MVCLVFNIIGTPRGLYLGFNQTRRNSLPTLRNCKLLGCKARSYAALDNHTWTGRDLAGSGLPTISVPGRPSLEADERFRITFS